MEETLEGGRGPPRAVAPLEREREAKLKERKKERKKENLNGRLHLRATTVDERMTVEGILDRYCRTG
jgi:RNase H-fold protein (predicted Holliday junction resolvase)